MGRAYPASKAAAGNTELITNFTPGASPRFCPRAVEYVGCVCANLFSMRRGNRTLISQFSAVFETERTPLSQLKLSISQGPKGESWLPEKAVQGKG